MTEDLNLQPSGYERPTLTGKINDYWQFRARSLTNVRVWLRRIIGYLLVGSGSSLWAGPPRVTMRSFRLLSSTAFPEEPLVQPDAVIVPNAMAVRWRRLVQF